MEIKEFINKYDPQNQFDVLKNTYRQIEYARDNKIDLKNISTEKIKNIVICGLGGSAISGDFVREMFIDELKIPVAVNRNYSLPAYVDENSLIIISSYSGNTEETVSCFNEAIKIKCKIVSISTGGKVAEIAEQNNIPFIKLQEGFQPRYTLAMSFFTLINLFQQLNLILPQDEFLDTSLQLIKKKGDEFSADENEALNIAQQLIGFIPVIYSCSDSTYSVGYRLKSQFNENSKLHAFHNVIPELNHNEIIGWESFSEKLLHAKIINIIDDDYHPQIKKRFEITKELAKRTGADSITLKSNEKNKKVRIMDLIYLGDWITYYVAVLRGYDPSEIDFIYELKQRLA